MRMTEIIKITSSYFFFYLAFSVIPLLQKVSFMISYDLSPLISPLSRHYNLSKFIRSIKAN